MPQNVHKGEGNIEAGKAMEENGKFQNKVKDEAQETDGCLKNLLD